jgi:hypothetical protein
MKKTKFINKLLGKIPSYPALKQVFHLIIEEGKGKVLPVLM